MTSLSQVTALVDAHSKRDYERFRAVTLQIAAQIAGKSCAAIQRVRKEFVMNKTPITHERLCAAIRERVERA